MRISGLVLTATLICLVFAISAAAEMKVLNPSQDNTIYSSNSGRSNGSGQRLFAGETNTRGERRALLRFAIADSIPAEAVIDSVMLTLNCSRVPANHVSAMIQLHAVDAEWDEGDSVAGALGENEGGGAPAQLGDATWSHRLWSTDMWIASGGDFSVLPHATLAVDGIGSYTWGSSALMVVDVATWLQQPNTNFGWILLAAESVPKNAKQFDSKEFEGTSDNWPALTVYYHIPDPVEPSTWGQIKGTYR